MEGFIFSQSGQTIQEILTYVEQRLPGTLQALENAIRDETTRATNKENELLGAIGGLIPKSEKGAENGVASLNGGGQVPNDQLQWSLRGVLNPSDIDSTSLVAGIYQVNGKVLGPGILDGEQANGVLLQFPWESRVQVLYVGRAAGASAGEQVEIYTRRYLPTPKRWTEWHKGGGMANVMTAVTWAELVQLRRESKLVAGMQYRITDFVTTVTQQDCQSAGHQFDIIVTADDEQTLNENARAIQHEGDTYFANSNLAAWKLKYTLDNDTEKYAWADAQNGKGIIYWMKDERGNECSYDFKNVQFKRYKITQCQKIPNLIGTYLGIKNGSNYSIDESDFIWSYTFAFLYENGEMVDTSIAGNDGTLLNDEGQISGVYGNVINEYYSYENYPETPKAVTLWLNDIVFLSDYNYDGTVYYGCHSNTFGNYCHSNTFGNSCYSNTFGNDCHSNTFGNDCYSNTFGNECYSNTFGNACNSNTFVNSCNSNTFVNSCYSNTFGYSCNSNTFGDSCNSNTFGNACYSNTFGNSCSSNTFGNDCNSNTFGNSYCRYVALEKGVRFTDVVALSTTSVNSFLQNIKVLAGVQGNVRTRKTLTFAVNKDYLQVAGMTSDGQVRVWNPADIV